MAYKKKTKKRAAKKNVETVVAHVNSTFNNTMVSVTTTTGDVLARGSAGQHGFKGSRKGTPFAATRSIGCFFTSIYFCIYSSVN